MSVSLSNSENNTNTVICPKCKQELPEDSQFCHYCGANIESTVISPTDNVLPETISEPSPVIHTLNHTETVKKSKKKPIIIGIISAVVVALITVLIILLVGNKGNDDDIYNVGVRAVSFEDKFTAEYVLATWENGTKTERSMIDIMDEYGSEQGGGQLYIITRGEFVEEIEEWCFSSKRKKGDYAIIENAYGFSLCYYSGYNLDESQESQGLENEATTSSNSTVTWLSNYRFLFYYDDSKYVLLFELSDENEKAVSASGTVEIRIVNDDNVTVYEKTRNFQKTSFKNWTYDDTDEMYLATIYIEPKDIKSSSTKYGTVYFTVCGDDYSFEECSISAFDLPTKSSTPQTNNSNANTNTNNNNNSNNNSNKTTCLELTCDNVVSKSGQYCSEHKCANSSCSFEKYYNSQYCSVCKCSNVGCKNLKTPSGYYCKEHTCKATGCTSKKQYSSDYCITHKCNSCNNIKIANGSYCVDHTCSKSGCTKDKQYGSEYCMFHTCMAGLCKKETLGNGDYCEEHTCIVPGCDEQKLLDDYCYYHTP